MKKIVNFLDWLFNRTSLKREIESLKKENSNIKKRLIKAADNVKKERRVWEIEKNNLETKLICKDFEIEGMKLMSEKNEYKE